MANHDIVSINIDSSKTFSEAIQEFRKTYQSDDWEQSSDTEYLMEVGFEYGFLAAAKAITGLDTGY